MELPLQTKEQPQRRYTNIYKDIHLAYVVVFFFFEEKNVSQYDASVWDPIDCIFRSRDLPFRLASYAKSIHFHGTKY